MFICVELKAVGLFVSIVFLPHDTRHQCLYYTITCNPLARRTNPDQCSPPARRPLTQQAPMHLFPVVLRVPTSRASSFADSYTPTPHPGRECYNTTGSLPCSAAPGYPILLLLLGWEPRRTGRLGPAASGTSRRCAASSRPRWRVVG